MGADEAGSASNQDQLRHLWESKLAQFILIKIKGTSYLDPIMSLHLSFLATYTVSRCHKLHLNIELKKERPRFSNL
ncbi:hypothetical protein BpHYR1_044845 [Brachionus plicatilis]|uniref:Uncharacterized protein n=1 Tax=Brachionus plicatilis TaxID=10195 RepID=A0A3M7RB09_BRAPC|nr:hypothetical protein BpHYR1_044845 [Brachionus plicatilis]